MKASELECARLQPGGASVGLAWALAVWCFRHNVVVVATVGQNSGDKHTRRHHPDSKQFSTGSKYTWPSRWLFNRLLELGRLSAWSKRAGFGLCTELTI